MHRAIEIQNIEYAWSGAQKFSLHIENLGIDVGETVLLSGASGAGKSTLLNLICGIIQPNQGAITVGGVDITRLKGAKRDRFRADHMGIIFQMFNLLPYASPLDNILLPLKFAPARAKSVKDPRAEALRLTKALGLDGQLVTGQKAAELSIGQQQRVAAARALIGKPALVIADEPTSALDGNSQKAFIEVLREQVSSIGSTLLMVSHDLQLAKYFNRRIDLEDLTQCAGELA
ncbi:ABC transporter ATP-binding protein [Flexibacterium corallicola]|uniref:ABC transporter ATP-binding protein n=1 Tax=Flexibacterium corallicola TaxID=3037259 RepID=UPI00286F8060|nr:ABC transporter ATP-binding protein [Pseudovibrio sp. M1P-2-3]